MGKLKRNSKAEKKKAVNEEAFETKAKEETPSLLDVIEEGLSEDGVELFDNENVVEKYLRLPKDITEIPSHELGRYLNAFTQQKMWTRTLVGRAYVLVREARINLDTIKAKVYPTLPAKMSIKEKDLHVASDPRSGEILDELMTYEERLRLLSDYLENIVDAIFNISREISRRESDWKDDKRESNIGKKRR
jgi:hypothetical protein